MNVLVLGAGGMGRVTAQTVAQFSFVRSVRVADMNAELAGHVASTIGAKAVSVPLDVTHTSQLMHEFAAVDLILNTVGPFYRFGVPVLQAAIHAGKPYADINDDWQPTLEMLSLHDDAVAAGVTALIGLGASPGISNMLALSAAQQLDTVDILLTGWDTMEALNEPHALTDTPSAAMIHWLHQTSGLIQLQQRGSQMMVKPLAEYHFEYPQVGSAVVWTVGHPEPLTLPRHVTGLSFSANVMTGSHALMGLLDAVRVKIDSGVVTLHAAAEYLLGQLMAHSDSPMVISGTKLPPLFAIAFGHKDGRPVTVAADLTQLPAGGMGGSTGIPLALAAPMLHEGLLNKAGVYSIEGLVQPRDFFCLLAPHITSDPTEQASLLQLRTAEGIHFTSA